MHLEKSSGAELEVEVFCVCGFIWFEMLHHPARGTGTCPGDTSAAGLVGYKMPDLGLGTVTS